MLSEVEADDELVIPGRVYIKDSKVSYGKPIMIVFFEGGDAVAFYDGLKVYKYFVQPTVSGLSLADPETEAAFLLDLRRALFIALQTR